VPGLGTSFGRGGATTAQQDISNADAVLVMGSNMAENHPVSFQWVMEAREKNRATIIHVDPRFTRTSAMADLWAPLRCGTDVLFLGGLIHYVLENEKYFREYVLHYTNAATILREDFKDTEELGGYFSGWDPEKRAYDPTSWLYAGSPQRGALFAGAFPDHGEADSDPTLKHPRCVFQVLKRHFSRYTPEMVERYCGVPTDVFLKIAQAYSSASGLDRTGAICYALGWTQHSNGVQIIRAAAILQLLLGNIGRPGGGILALRGHASIQGSTDIATLFDILPGYLPTPVFNKDANTFREYLVSHQAKTGWYANFDKYIVSFLKAYYGEAATTENDYCFDYLPRITGDHSQYGFWLDMMDEKVEGLFLMGQNPVVGAANSRLERKALARLKWLVVREMVETEPASFWYNSPEVERGELSPDTIATEVFLFPAAGSAEKSGTFVNTQRMLQFRNKAVEPPGDARSETWFMCHLGRRLKAKAAAEKSSMNAPLNALVWDYTTGGEHTEPDVEEVLREINGWTTDDHRQVPGFTALKADGSTACGAWIYSGCYPEEGKNLANQRRSRDLYGHGWGFSWPSDRRIIYNRASARPDGKPWSERKKLIWWDEESKQWTGLDVPDFTRDKPPDYIPPAGAGGDAALRGDKPFILHPDGLGWLYVSTGLKDGPLPVHYEPLESPIANPVYPDAGANPVANKRERPDNQYASSPGDKRYPFVLTTYRLTEHHTAGGMTRTLSHLAELQPELFCEVSPELAKEVGLEHGFYATISSPRGMVEARVCVTSRIRPVVIDGKRVHQVGLPFHWGSNGLAKGDSANELIAVSEEPNVQIMESKALVCNIRSGRRPRGKTQFQKPEVA
jgi:formate dehydrogenase major subunit